VGGVAKKPDEPLLWDAAVRRLPIDRPVSVEWRTDIPRSRGLSGSTALLAATVGALRQARDEPPIDKSALAELVRDIERNEAGIMCGYQDAYMIVYGGLLCMDFAGKHPIEPGPQATLTPLTGDLPFLLISTDVERLSGAVHGPMSERWLRGEPAVVEGMSEVAALGREGGNALTKADWNTLAKAMNRNHEIIASLGGSGEAIDALIKACLEHGAKAAKLAGAGMGGTVIALTENSEELKARLLVEGYRTFMQPEITAGLAVE
jgi:galactokinase/mevalonate kinase-like predicted kinase